MLSLMVMISPSSCDQNKAFDNLCCDANGGFLAPRA